MRRLLLSAAIDYDKAMQNISTKTGDKGETSLADGRRVSKADLRVRVVGDLDELNSWLGVVVSHLGDAFTEQRQFLKTIQQDLFTLGAEIALADTEQVDQQLLEQIEQRSQALQQTMAKNWHSKFLLPGGVPTAAWTDVARTVCRRVERSLVALSEQDQQAVRPLVIKIINRLSDYLYVLRCFINQKLEFKELEH